MSNELCGLLRIVVLTVLPLILHSEVEGSFFVPPVAGPIEYSPCPSEGDFIQNDPETWYSTSWTGRYSGSSDTRCEGTGGHPGVDIRRFYGIQTEDLSIYAIGDGVVVKKRQKGGWGKFIVIKHDNVPGYGTIYSIYAHLKRYEEKIDQGKEGEISVERRERIGTMGETGGVPVHLHFQIDQQWNFEPDKEKGQCNKKGTPFWPCYTDKDKKGRDIKLPYPSSKKKCGPEFDDCLSEFQRQEAAQYVAANTINPMWLVDLNYTLSNSTNIEATQGFSGSNTITRTLVSGVAEPVSLSTSGLPSGATAEFTNNPCDPSCSSTLTISTSTSTPIGTFPITITGIPLDKSTTFNLVVSSPLPQCSDGIDNDGDGFIDFPSDPGCFSPSHNSERMGTLPRFREIPPR